MIGAKVRAEKGFKEELVKLIPRLRRFAFSLTHNKLEADDLVQDACKRALEKRRLWEPGTKLDSWMFKIIYNLMIDKVRSSRNRKIHFSLEEERLCNSIDTTKQIEARIQLKRVREAMERLKDEDRAIISLVCIEGMRYKEVAEILSIPIGTVMSRLARARKKLHSLVYKEGKST